MHATLYEYTDQPAADDARERLDPIQLIKNRNIHKPLMSFETAPLGRYYVLFPWTDCGSLEELMTAGYWTPPSSEVFSWGLRQMVSLMDGLKALHDINVRHRALCPTNILLVGRPGSVTKERRLVIAGLQPKPLREMGKVTYFRTVTNSRDKSVAGTVEDVRYQDDARTLHPIRGHGGPFSRKSDVWSIGVIFLEFIIWLFQGVEAIDNFRESSGEINFDGYEVKLQADGENEVFSRALGTLREVPRCAAGTVWRDLIDILDNSVLAEESSRYTSAELHARVEKMAMDAKADHSYVFNGQPVKTLCFKPGNPDTESTQTKYLSVGGNWY
ncbi:hypothetical protein QBC34DRAFT_117440 [Podospora aff. communis PSN243]|uniref:Protein kinase domain-containing protein n=1 Tax=Podospora aff. communis PSN243 TaxID=3040156 RepID=A0AAV9GIZ0_9PEZI|nr:hypothetical protein QBC34DRAFT_117440 [Podospora aff. communis PSN243]